MCRCNLFKLFHSRISYAVIGAALDCREESVAGFGRAVADMVSCRLLTSEAGVRLQVG